MQPFLQQFSRRYPLFAAIFSSISFCSHSCINNRLLQQPFLYAAISAVVFPQPFFICSHFCSSFLADILCSQQFSAASLFAAIPASTTASSAAAIFVCSHFRSSFSAALFYLHGAIFAAVFSQISFVRSNFQQHLFLQPFLQTCLLQQFFCSHSRSIVFMQPFLQQFVRNNFLQPFQQYFLQPFL